MSSQSSDKLDAETFGPLLSIPEISLVILARTIRADILGITSSSGRLIHRVSGSYNLVHIIQLDDGFKLIIRIPATGWGFGLTATAAQAMESQVTTLRLIASKTTIPVPQVYAFDTTSNNTINAPYICMSFLPGQTLATAWFDTTLPTPLEERRLRTLTALSECLPQLAQFTFLQIGSLHKDNNSSDLAIGPCYDWKENEDGSYRVIASGPYDTVAAYLHDHVVASDNTNSPWKLAKTKVTKAALRYLPSLKSSSQGFVLSVPDFDSQNILVDEEGNLTGIIDWDLVQTIPRCVGYARYPGWITRDWDPLMHGWPKICLENSPDELHRYRMHYNQSMGEAMQRSEDWEFTRNSHIWEAIWIAALNEMNRLEICLKLVQEATGADAASARGLMYDIGTGDADWQKLETQLEVFLTSAQS